MEYEEQTARGVGSSPKSPRKHSGSGLPAEGQEQLPVKQRVYSITLISVFLLPAPMGVAASSSQLNASSENCPWAVGAA